MTKKKFLPLPILLLLVLSVINMKTTRVSGGEYPAIYVEPSSIIDTGMTPGTNFTISIKTDYNDSNVQLWQFHLAYDPSVLQGVEVINGDLITEEKDPRFPDSDVFFKSGTFDNALGELTLTFGYFKWTDRPVPLTYGPGTLANVTFTVVGKGTSNITLGPETFLLGWTEDGYGDYYLIIYADTMPTHIQHGYFDNRLPHDVAVISVTAPDKAVVGSIMPIEVEVANIGTSAEVAEVIVYYDNTTIAGQNATLPVGESETVLFEWNTTGLAEGTYTINATATILGDVDPADNWKTTTFLVVHDVAVMNLTAPTKAAVGSFVPISVEVANEGSFAEVANVTIRYDSTLIGFNGTVALPAQNSTAVLFEWNTTGLAEGTYTINATAAILGDVDPADNWKTTTILVALHNVAVTKLEAPATATPGDTVSIGVEVSNIGASDEVVEVVVSYDGTYIDSENVTLAKGTNTTSWFDWNTTGLAEGTYTINATATILGDVDPADNWKTTTILLAVHDVSVTSISAPYTAYIGENVTIEVLVINKGGHNETFEVVVSYDGTYIDSENVTLASYPSPAELLSFTWNTTDLDPASYTINATATILDDIDPTDNWKATTIDVKSPPGTIAGTVADASTGLPIAGANVTANDDYTNTTDADGYYAITDVPPGTYNVTVSAAKYIKQSKTATVTADTTTTLDFTLTPLNGTISGTVTDSSTGDPVSGAHVNANGISVSTDTDGSYTIELAPGTYNVTVSADGYEDSSKTNINVIAGETKTVNFKLTPTQPSQPPNILLYAGVAATAIIIIAAIAVYILKVRKPA